VDRMLSHALLVKAAQLLVRLELELGDVRPERLVARELAALGVVAALVSGGGHLRHVDAIGGERDGVRGLLFLTRDAFARAAGKLPAGDEQHARWAGSSGARQRGAS